MAWRLPATPWRCTSELRNFSEQATLEPVENEHRPRNAVEQPFMTSLLARVGAFESRLASQTLWNPGKRKRGEWVCAECRSGRTLRQRRAYGDDSLRITPDQYLFPPREFQPDDEEKAPVRRVPLVRSTQLQRPVPWGVKRQDSETNQLEEQEGRDEVDQAEEEQNSLWEQFEQVDDAGAEHEQEQISNRAQGLSLSSNREAVLLDIDYASELSMALVNNAPDMVARCLIAAAKRDDLEFIRSIPSTTFAECIRLLQPSNFTENLANAHVEISEAMARAFGITSMQKVAWEHSNLLQEVLGIRRSAGIKLGLEEYRMLLRCSRDLGSKGMAVKLWMNMLNEGLTPDTACYNYYMAASIWNGLHNAAERHKVRVIPFNLLARRQRHLGPGYTSYRVGDGGVKAKILKVFGDMLKHGAVADEESFRNVITAAAREGDVATVKSVLKKVWDIDVDALKGGNEGVTEVKSMDKNSPLRPTSKLLFTIAHAFGINNDVPTALRCVDFVARRYDIHINIDVWSQLFEWTFVLATPRTGAQSRRHGTNNGQLPKQSVLSLWETMTGAPYLVKPTIGMYNHLIKNLQHRDWPPNLYEKMREGVELYYVTRRTAQKAYKKLKNEVERQEKDPDATPGTSLEALRREWEHLDLLRRRDNFWIRRWLRLLLSTIRAWLRVDRSEDWSLRQIPTILWEWRLFAPRTVKYETNGGTVEFAIRTEAEIEDGRQWKQAKSEEEEKVLDRVPLLIGEEWVRSRHRRKSGKEWSWTNGP